MPKKITIQRVLCINCKHGIPPIENYMIGCKLSRHLKPACFIICNTYEPKTDTDTAQSDNQ